MSAGLLLAFMFLGPGSDTVSVTDRALVERMNNAFRHAHTVRVVLQDTTFYVKKPQARMSELRQGPFSERMTPALSYEMRPELRLRRPSLISPQAPPPLPPKGPIAFSEIQRVEWRHGGTGTGILVGTLTGAAILAGVIATVNGSHSDVGPSVPSVMLGAVAGGALAGVIASGVAAKTEVIYRAP